MIKNVIKRSGELEEFDVLKIRRQLEFACKDTDINPLEIESKLKITSEVVTTTDLQDVIMTTAIKLTSLDEPDMIKVAGRLAMWQLYRQVYKQTKLDYHNFYEFITTFAVDNNLYNFNLLSNYTKDDLAELSKFIDGNLQDFELTIAQVASLKSKYLLKLNGSITEYPIWANLVNAMILANNYTDRVSKAKQYFNLLNNNVISLATPFKRNLRVPNGNTGSCFILPISDSWEGIAKAIMDAGVISRAGGGLGVYVTPIRPQGSKSDKIPSAGNIMNWVRFFNDIANSVTQASANRKGAITPAIDWYHLDSNDFVEMKTETAGELRLKAFDLFPQIVVDDVFIDAVLNDDFVYQFDHYEAGKLLNVVIPYLIGDAFKDTYSKIVKLIEDGKLKHFRKVKAKELWKRYLEIYIETGDFYINHKDNLNIDNRHQDIGVATCGNLCVVGDTKILTKEYGYKEIIDLEDQQVNVWNGSEWSETTIVKTSEGQKVVKVETNGGTIECTPYHKFYVAIAGKTIEKRAYELHIGDKLIKFDLPIIDGYKEFSCTNLKSGDYFVPDKAYTVQSRLRWLAQLMDNNGILFGDYSIQIKDKNYIFLHNVLLMLQTLGVVTTLNKREDSYRLLIGENGVQALLSLGLKTFRLQPKLRQPSRNAEQFIQVTAIVDEGKIEPTWCFTESKKHLGMFNGLCTGQCQESYSLIKPATKYSLDVVEDKITNYTSDGLYHSCSLISINVADIDKYDIEEVAKCAVEMLDNSIDTGTMPVPEAKNSSELFRNIGIGILGLADYLASKNVVYNSEKGYYEAEKLIELISFYTFKGSMEIAKEKGSYKAFNGIKTLFGTLPEELNQRSLNNLDWVGLINDINKYGLRNGWLLAIAPNTSTGLLMGTTASYLPPQEKFFYQKLGGMNVPVMPKFIKTNYWSYKAKYQIPAHDIVHMTTRLQRWVDTGISMELFINPENTNIKLISDSILNAFKNKELKAVYYSLTIDSKESNKCIDCAN